MIVEFDKSFDKALDKIKDRSIFPKVEKIILSIEKADSISELHFVKKLNGFQNYYRIRVGDYRIGFEKLNDGRILFLIIANRKDIYKLFP